MWHSEAGLQLSPFTCGSHPFQTTPGFVTAPHHQPPAGKEGRSLRQGRVLFPGKERLFCGERFFLSFCDLLSEILFRNLGLHFVFFVSVDPGSEPEPEPQQRSGLWLFQPPGLGAVFAALACSSRHPLTSSLVASRRRPTPANGTHTPCCLQAPMVNDERRPGTPPTPPYFIFEATKRVHGEGPK